ncbi:YihY/virulence factor BrkB family protein [Corallococcus sp. H22C18031201]|uniref:YihY/virulence factor BrkB family protein n=1 Tax=Citreicoccus inhibens TaxID=2849499 RepID=UPI000E763189|nr:YihY/virulence factor BrkB family protein [Citreicoccus inhibens]MBU8896532.1 YihY/virulence factor BrkB family protein [Citreicoccus inhibens]RJS18754.1 YihY/virulence factor BrkB family protein [Corallococcus sp. H22C18031201]
MVLPGKGIGWKTFLVELKNEWTRDNVSDVAGSLTFRGILALFPFLLFLVSLAGVLIDPHQAQTLIHELSRVAPKEVTAILSQRIQALADSRPVGLLTVGGVGAVWAASGGISALMTALNTAYGVQETRPLWKTRGIAVATTLVTALVAILAAVVAVATPAVAGKLGAHAQAVLLWLRLPVAGLMMMFLWAVLYYVLPDVAQRFRFITPGSVVGVLIWLVASWGFSTYVANFGKYDVNYGAIGGVIVLLLWMWISAQVILLGAEINAILGRRSREPGSPAAPRAHPRMSVTEQTQDGVPDEPEAQPVALARTPLAAAAKWVAGLGVGLFLFRRGESR